MRFYLSQINQLLEKIEKGKTRALLLYGPDKGYINEVCSIISKKLEMISTSISTASHNAIALGMLASTRNFFNQRELIRYNLLNNNMDPALKTILAQDFFHFIVFIGDELPPTSAFRKFFESQEVLGSIGCYYDDEQNITKIILKRCTAAVKQIDNEALTYLTTHLKGDYQLVNNEITKLLYYVHDKDRINLEDVTSILGIDLSINSDALCIYLAQQNLSGFLMELTRLLHHNVNEVLIIRALLRYYINLYIVRIHIENRTPVDEAIKFLQPPIFFKYVNDFKKIASILTANDAVRALNVLQEAEVAFKLFPVNFDFYQQIFVQIHQNLR